MPFLAKLELVELFKEYQAIYQVHNKLPEARDNLEALEKFDAGQNLFGLECLNQEKINAFNSLLNKYLQWDKYRRLEHLKEVDSVTKLALQQANERSNNTPEAIKTIKQVLLKASVDAALYQAPNIYKEFSLPLQEDSVWEERIGKTKNENDKAQLRKLRKEWQPRIHLAFSNSDDLLGRVGLLEPGDPDLLAELKAYVKRAISEINSNSTLPKGIRDKFTELNQLLEKEEQLIAETMLDILANTSKDLASDDIICSHVIPVLEVVKRPTEYRTILPSREMTAEKLQKFVDYIEAHGLPFHKNKLHDLAIFKANLNDKIKFVSVKTTDHRLIMAPSYLETYIPKNAKWFSLDKKRCQNFFTMEKYYQLLVLNQRLRLIQNRFDISLPENETRASYLHTLAAIYQAEQNIADELKRIDKSRPWRIFAWLFFSETDRLLNAWKKEILEQQAYLAEEKSKVPIDKLTAESKETLIDVPKALEQMQRFAQEDLSRSFVLSNFSQDEIVCLKKHIEDATREGNNLEQELFLKIQNISLENSDWIKLEFEQGEIECLEKFLVKKQESDLSAKLLLSPNVKDVILDKFKVINLKINESLSLVTELCQQVEKFLPHPSRTDSGSQIAAKDYTQLNEVKAQLEQASLRLYEAEQVYHLRNLLQQKNYEEALAIIDECLTAFIKLIPESKDEEDILNKCLTCIEQEFAKLSIEVKKVLSDTESNMDEFNKISEQVKASQSFMMGLSLKIKEHLNTTEPDEDRIARVKEKLDKDSQLLTIKEITSQWINLLQKGKYDDAIVIWNQNLQAFREAADMLDEKTEFQQDVLDSLLKNLAAHINVMVKTKNNAQGQLSVVNEALSTDLIFPIRKDNEDEQAWIARLSSEQEANTKKLNEVKDIQSFINKINVQITQLPSSVDSDKAKEFFLEMVKKMKDEVDEASGKLEQRVITIDWISLLEEGNYDKAIAILRNSLITYKKTSEETKKLHQCNIVKSLLNSLTVHINDIKAISPYKEPPLDKAFALSSLLIQCQAAFESSGLLEQDPLAKCFTTLQTTFTNLTQPVNFFRVHLNNEVLSNKEQATSPKGHSILQLSGKAKEDLEKIRNPGAWLTKNAKNALKDKGKEAYFSFDNQQKAAVDMICKIMEGEGEGTYLKSPEELSSTISLLFSSEEDPEKAKTVFIREVLVDRFLQYNSEDKESSFYQIVKSYRPNIITNKEAVENKITLPRAAGFLVGVFEGDVSFEKFPVDGVMVGTPTLSLCVKQIEYIKDLLGEGTKNNTQGRCGSSYCWEGICKTKLALS